MQRTEKYFEQDAFRTQCESIILAAEPDEKTGGVQLIEDPEKLEVIKKEFHENLAQELHGQS